jgi:hypothetical protein
VSRYCPAGDGIFEDWVQACPECGRALTEEPPDELGERQDAPRIVWLVTAPNEPEAQMWAETLRREGIPVFVRPGGPGVGAWASVASFEHELFVRERDLAAARRLSRSLLSDNAPARRLVPRRRSTPTARGTRRPR